MNKFGKPIFVALLLIGMSYSSFAQRATLRANNNRPLPANDNLPREAQTRRVQLIKENFIVRELALTPDEAVKFLHIYRSYQNALGEIRRLKRVNNSSLQSDGRAQLDRDLSYDRKLIDTKEFYQNEFLKLMPPEKVSKMYKSEQTFKDEIFRNLNERQN
jgi:hypothetical protein